MELKNKKKREPSSSSLSSSSFIKEKDKNEKDNEKNLTFLNLSSTLFPRGKKSQRNSTDKEKTVFKKNNKRERDTTFSLSSSSSSSNLHYCPKKKKRKLTHSFKSLRHSTPKATLVTSLLKEKNHSSQKLNLESVYSDGSLTIGIIKYVRKLELIVALPNGKWGTVSITEISDGFTEMIEQFTSSTKEEHEEEEEEEKENNSNTIKEIKDHDLEKKSTRHSQKKLEATTSSSTSTTTTTTTTSSSSWPLPDLKSLFHPGQLVCVKIIDLVANLHTQQCRIELTMHPKYLHASLTLASFWFNQNFLLQASLKSQEDHGWIVDLGVPDPITAFLPFTSLSTMASNFSLKTLVKGNVIWIKPWLGSSGTSTSTSLPLRRTLQVAWVPSLTFQELATFTQVVPLTYVPFALPLPSSTGSSTLKNKWSIPSDFLVGGFVKGTVVRCAHKSSTHGTGGGGLVIDVQGLRGWVPMYHVSDTPHLSQLEKKFAASSTHSFRILKLLRPDEEEEKEDDDHDQKEENHVVRSRTSRHLRSFQLWLTAKPGFMDPSLPLIDHYDPLFLHVVTQAVIVKVLPHGCVVQFFNQVIAWVPLSYMAYTPLEETSVFQVGQLVKCKIIHVDPLLKKMKASFLWMEESHPSSLDLPFKKKPTTDLSTSSFLKSIPPLERSSIKKSDLLKKSFDFSKLPNTRRIETLQDVSPNMQVYGYVQNVRDRAGVFVALSPHLEGRIQITHLSNDYVKNWKSLVQVGQPLQCRVLSIHENGKIELTCKSDPLLDVETEGSGPPSSSSSSSSLESSRVVSSNLMHPCHLNLSSSSSSSLDMVSSLPPTSERDLHALEHEVSSTSLEPNGFSWTHDTAPPSEEDNEEEEEEEKEEEKEKKNDDEGNEEEKEATSALSLSSTKAHRLRTQTRHQEETWVQSREATLRQEGPPQLAEDYERLLVAQPGSSYLWIQYMAFYVQQGNLPQSRKIAERALRTISFRLEQEKYHVWIAWMNLEHQFGSHASLMQVVNEAIQYQAPKPIYLHLFSLYISDTLQKKGTSHHDQVHTFFNDVLMKQFATSRQCWLAYMHYLIESNQVSLAREKMTLALKKLPSHKHVYWITQCAILEYKFGDPSRGCTLFEGLLAHHPKRFDVWNVFVDQVLGHRKALMESSSSSSSSSLIVSTETFLRTLFLRWCAMHWAPKKMKCIFKKFLAFEKSVGDPALIEVVKKKALDYVHDHLEDVEEEAA
ncbi:hypothetical protein HMI54_004014 [Coelomomyces lativittatus]|nr:hypothetical protein HMI56_006562 [Coelomomyces lativittatus]KAJ1511934.1 hypothetical protein HMI55_006419 [Coelomomyces lativittatus]KAJ1517795.1 hypothetical protein HMI54_004014 [Coelomomyces lativittatus]